MSEANGMYEYVCESEDTFEWFFQPPWNLKNVEISKKKKRIIVGNFEKLGGFWGMKGNSENYQNVNAKRASFCVSHKIHFYLLEIN